MRTNKLGARVPPRPMAEINAEYAKCCSQLGDMTYRISCFEQEARNIRRTLKDLNVEAEERRMADEAAAKSSEAPAAEAVPNEAQ